MLCQRYDDDYDDDDDDKPVFPTWAVGVLSVVRDVFTSIAYVFTYSRLLGVETDHPC